ncbi:hypothetical protein ACS79_07400 [Vibrio lentus]|nr:hypothetical protein ACS79_07400 [Vibrio lentus]
MKYSIYKTQLDKIQKSNKGKRMLKSHIGKSTINHEDFAEFCWETIPLETSEALTSFRVVNREMMWEKNGSPVIFWEDSDLVEKLYRSKFSLDCGLKVIPLFETFSMSFPENTVIDGCELKSCLVSILTRKEAIEMQFPLSVTDEELSIAYGCFSKEDLDKQIIMVNYEMNKDGGGNLYYEVADFIEERNQPNDETTTTIEIFAKLAISACIYHSVTEGSKLINGFPSVALALPKGKLKSAYTGFELKGSQPIHGSKQNRRRKIQCRVPFYRNLRAERYYQGKYKDAERGSRWVLVREIDARQSMNTLVN